MIKDHYAVKNIMLICEGIFTSMVEKMEKW